MCEALSRLTKAGLCPEPIAGIPSFEDLNLQKTNVEVRDEIAPAHDQQLTVESLSRSLRVAIKNEMVKYIALQKLKEVKFLN